MSLSKAKITDIISILLIIISFIYQMGSIAEHILYTGLFAISGAITNQLAIYMLFNRVPFLYGSGVNREYFSSLLKSLLKI